MAENYITQFYSWSPGDTITDSRLNGNITNITTGLSGGAKAVNLGKLIINGTELIDVSGNATIVDLTATGDAGVGGDLDVTGYGAFGNIKIDTNTISSTDTDGDINFSPNGTGASIFSGNVYSEALTDYSSTSTIVGFSSYSIKVVSYKRIGKMVWVSVRIDGTSNATSTTVTLPYTASDSLSNIEGAQGTVFDNGARLSGGGRYQLTSNTNIITFYSNLGDGLWTASNRKIVSCNFWYEAKTI